MSEYEMLKEIYEETMNRVFKCSANYQMTVPRKGLEREHEKYREWAEMLESLMMRAK